MTEFGDRVFREVKFSGHKDEAQVLSGWCPCKQSHQSSLALSLSSKAHRGKAYEDAERRWLSTNQKERLHKELNQLSPQSETSNLQNCKKKKNLLSKHNMVCYYGTKLTNTNRESYMEFRPHFSFLEPSFLLSKCSLSHFKFIFLKTGHSACEYLNGIRHLVG